MVPQPTRSSPLDSSAASDVFKRQTQSNSTLALSTDGTMALTFASDASGVAAGFRAIVTFSELPPLCEFFLGVNLNSLQFIHTQSRVLITVILTLSVAIRAWGVPVGVSDVAWIRDSDACDVRKQHEL